MAFGFETIAQNISRGFQNAGGIGCWLPGVHRGSQVWRHLHGRHQQKERAETMVPRRSLRVKQVAKEEEEVVKAIKKVPRYTGCV